MINGWAGPAARGCECDHGFQGLGFMAGGQVEIAPACSSRDCVTIWRSSPSPTQRPRLPGVIGLAHCAAATSIVPQPSRRPSLHSGHQVCTSTTYATQETRSAASGASLRDLMARMGHDSERSAMIYQDETRRAWSDQDPDRLARPGRAARQGGRRRPSAHARPAGTGTEDQQLPGRGHRPRSGYRD